MEDWVYVVGLIMGAVALGSACWVWLRKQTFGVGGGMLSLVGVILIGLSLWANVKVEVSAEGLKAEFERMERRLDAMAEANVSVSEEVRNLATVTETHRSQFVKLTESLERQQTLAPEILAPIRREVEAAPRIDERHLTTAIQQLQTSGQQPRRRDEP